MPAGPARTSTRISSGRIPSSNPVPRPAGIGASVAGVEYLGADSIVTCAVGRQTLAVRAPGRITLAPGAPVRLSWSPEVIHVFDAQSGSRRDDAAAVSSIFR